MNNKPKEVDTRLEDAYNNWQEAVSIKQNLTFEEIDKLEENYYLLFQEISSQSDFFTHGLKI